MMDRTMLPRYSAQITQPSSTPTRFPIHVPTANSGGMASAVTTVQIRAHRKIIGQRFHRAQHVADQIHRQVFFHSSTPDFHRLLGDGQRLFDQYFHLIGWELLLFQPPSFQQLRHRNSQQFGQRQEQGDVRHAQSRLP